MKTMDVKIILEGYSLEALEKIIPRLLKLQKENPGAVLHVEAKTD